MSPVAAYLMAYAALAHLIEIDHYGERLIGCLECNVWRGDKRAFIVELSVGEIEALHGLDLNPANS